MQAIDYATHTRRAHELRARAIDAAVSRVCAAVTAALAAPFRFLVARSRQFAAQRRGTSHVQHC
jgi:uncharacterized protein (DUF58 family)